jgi:hypothetical protein
LLNDRFGIGADCNRDKSIIRPIIVSRVKAMVEQHFSLTEQRLKVLAKTLVAGRFNGGQDKDGGFSWLCHEFALDGV